jgi:hypothetical protein
MIRTVASLRWLAAALPIVLCAPAVAGAAACSLEVIGTWKLSDAAEVSPPLISFARDGWANVLSGAGEGTPGDIVAQVNYRVQPARDPRRIEFQSRRGNDVFPPGTSSWEITAYTDESFSARRTDSIDGTQSLWSRVQTHRYFLTFAARKDAAERATAAFVMWTTLDGRRMELDALGRVLQGTEVRFGRIPHQLAKEFAKQGDPARDVMMRLELSEAEYLRTREVYKTQLALLSRNTRERDDPDSQASRLIEATVQSLNQCGARIRTADTVAVAGGSTVELSRRPLELVRTIRKANDRRHVPDKAFPFIWKPAELS